MTFGASFHLLSKSMNDGWRLPSSPVLYLAGAFWVLVALSVSWSDIKSVSLMGFCFFSVMPLIFFSGVIGAKECFYKNIATILAFMFGILSLWAITQFFFLNNYFNGQATHPLADPSSLGALLSLGLFCSIGWLLSSSNNKTKNIATGLSIALMCGVISTVARGPILAAIPAMIVMAWLLWPQVRTHKKYLAVFVLCAVAFYGLTHLGIEKRLDLGERLFGTFANGVSAENGRLTIWSSALDIIKDHPWMGTGIGTFFLYYPQYRELEAFNNITLAHNDPLQFWVELGFLGPILFYAFVAAAAVRTFKALSKLKTAPNQQDKVVIVTIFSALMALVLGSHIGFNHYNLSILMIEGFLLGIWFLVTSRVLGEKVHASEMPKNVPMILNKALLAAPFFITGFMLFGLVLGEVYANRASDSLFKEDMFSFADNVNNSSRVSQDMNYRVYIFAVNVPIAILEFKGDKIEKKEAQKLYNQATGYMARVLQLNPQSGVAYYYLGKVQTLVPKDIIPDGTPSAEHQFKEALKRDKAHYAARLSLLNIMEARGDSIEDRLSMMEEGARFTYNMTGARHYYGALTKLYLEARDYGNAKEIARKMMAFEDRAKKSQRHQATSIPQALFGGDDVSTMAP